MRLKVSLLLAMLIVPTLPASAVECLWEARVLREGVPSPDDEIGLLVGEVRRDGGFYRFAGLFDYGGDFTVCRGPVGECLGGRVGTIVTGTIYALPYGDTDADGNGIALLDGNVLFGNAPGMITLNRDTRSGLIHGLDPELPVTLGATGLHLDFDSCEPSQPAK